MSISYRNDIKITRTKLSNGRVRDLEEHKDGYWEEWTTEKNGDPLIIHDKYGKIHYFAYNKKGDEIYHGVELDRGPGYEQWFDDNGDGVEYHLNRYENGESLKGPEYRKIILKWINGDNEDIKSYE